MKLKVDTLDEAKTVFEVLMKNNFECKLEADTKEVLIYFYEPARQGSKILNE